VNNNKQLQRKSKWYFDLFTDSSLQGIIEGISSSHHFGNGNNNFHCITILEDSAIFMGMKQSHHIRIRITEQQFEHLNLVLIKEQTTPSTLIRRLINSYILENMNDNDEVNKNTMKL